VAISPTPTSFITPPPLPSRSTDIAKNIDKEKKSFAISDDSDKKKSNAGGGSFFEKIIESVTNVFKRLIFFF
jgi:hypothetical protein